MFPIKKSTDTIISSLDKQLDELSDLIDRKDAEANVLVAESVRLSILAVEATTEADRARVILGDLSEVVRVHLLN
jgi:hypothetical protein